jgi:hypothetical protein
MYKNTQIDNLTKKNVMRRLIFVAFLFCFLALCSHTSKAQNYLSKPTAVKNLADEAKYLTARMPNLERNDPNGYTIARQKLRVIRNLLRDLKFNDDLSVVVDRYMPSGDIRKLQQGTALFLPPDGSKNRLAWLRDELMPLVSY